MTRYKQSTRWVKVYFRDQDKIMRAIPDLIALVHNDSLAKMYTLNKHGVMNRPAIIERDVE